ncbi:MAG: hypothetical protein ACREOE_13750, partial [Gemmatimonadales bacterium]
MTPPVMSSAPAGIAHLARLDRLGTLTMTHHPLSERTRSARLNSVTLNNAARRLLPSFRTGLARHQARLTALGQLLGS